MTPLEVVEGINRAWTENRAGEIGQWLDPQAMIVGPHFERAATGREACVAGYVDFAAHAAIDTFEVLNKHADVVGDTAVVSYAFRLVYRMRGETREDMGTDIFVLRNSPGGWLVVWRMLGADG
jgi:hypothetical protein